MLDVVSLHPFIFIKVLLLSFGSRCTFKCFYILLHTVINFVKARIWSPQKRLEVLKRRGRAGNGLPKTLPQVFTETETWIWLGYVCAPFVYFVWIFQLIGLLLGLFTEAAQFEQIIQEFHVYFRLSDANCSHQSPKQQAFPFFMYVLLLSHDVRKGGCAHLGLCLVRSYQLLVKQQLLRGHHRSPPWLPEIPEIQYFQWNHSDPQIWPFLFKENGEIRMVAEEKS